VAWTLKILHGSLNVVTSGPMEDEMEIPVLLLTYGVSPIPIT